MNIFKEGDIVQWNGRPMGMHQDAIKFYTTGPLIVHKNHRNQLIIFRNNGESNEMNLKLGNYITSLECFSLVSFSDDDFEYVS